MADTIFHGGPIEAAISSAIQQDLSLACFIADDSEESSKWEDEYMRDKEVLPLLQSQSVLLRLQAGSVEAGFLAAFCPIQAVPYLVVIKNGALVANISAGASRDEFTQRIRNALPGTSQDAEKTTEPSTNETGPPEASTPFPTSPTPLLEPSSNPSSSSSSAPSSSTTANYQAAYEARKARLEAQRAEQEAADQAARLARSQTRRESSAGTPDAPGRVGNMTYLEQQRKRVQAAQEERQRVLQLLENDKIERRRKEAKRKEALEQSQSGPSSSLSKENVKPATPRPTSKETAISFRLLDGSSLKARFPSHSLLGTEVREWLDQNRNDGDHPYSFLQILAPLPNKPLTLTDESSTLVDLGLSPTATLVLVPTQTYTTAYRGGGTSNEVGLLGKAYNMVYGAFTTVLGVGYPSTPPAPTAPPHPPTPATVPRVETAAQGGQPMSRSSSANGRIRTLYDNRGEGGEGGERKYYNGNQLDFEPKRDEKGKDRKE